MRIIFVLSLVVTVIHAYSWTESLLGFHNGDNCDFTRDEALTCIAKYVDIDHNGEITSFEFERAKSLYTPPQLRVAEWVLNRMGYYISIADVMTGCDANHDGRLTLIDWKESVKTCLPAQSDLCKLKTVCDRAEAMTVKDPRIH